MLDLTEKQKEVFYSDRYSFKYECCFPETNLEFDNETLHSEDVTIKETICDEEDLILGGCIASSIEYTVSEIIADQIGGLEFTTKLHVLDEDGNTVVSLPMGVYRVDSAKRVDDKDYKQVVAYDRLYDASVDVSAWYNDLFPVIGTETVPSTDEEGNKTTVTKNIYGSTTVRKMRESLLQHLGIPFASQALPNDEIVVEKTIEPGEGSLPGTNVLKALCTVNGGFGRMNREGEFEVIHLKGLGVFPEDSKGVEGNLYPEETLYPEDSFEYLGMSDEENEYPEYRSVTYEEYMTQPITCLTIQTDEEDVGLTIGEDTSNPYVITANFLLYGKSSEELKAVGQNIFSRLEGLTYRPNTTELNGLPYLECGDVFLLQKRTDTVESYIFNRTLTGIQALIDTFEAKGNKVRANEVSQSEEIQQLKGKMLKIIKESDRFSISLSDLEKDAESLLEMTATNILLQVQKNGKVAAMTLDGSGKETTFSIEADNINFNGKTFNLTSDDIDIQSAYFSVNKEGEVTAKAIDITGGKINFTSSLEGDSSILLRNAKYEGAYNGPIRFTGMGPPKSPPKEMGAETGDIYLDRESGRTYTYLNNRVGWFEVVMDAEDVAKVPSPIIRFYGSGAPVDSPETFGARPGELYMDLETGNYYTSHISSDGKQEWGYTGSGQLTNVDEWTEISLNTEEGFAAEKYSYTKYEVGEGNGNISSTEYLGKNSRKCKTGPEGVSFGIVDHYSYQGNLVETSAEVNLSAGLSKTAQQSGEAPHAILECDAPFYATNIRRGSIIKNITSVNTRFTAEVELDMPSTPSVVVTPVTTNPSAVSVSVAEISESGFTIYMYRTDTTGNLQVNWIAMC